MTPIRDYVRNLLQSPTEKHLKRWRTLMLKTEARKAWLTKQMQKRPGFVFSTRLGTIAKKDKGLQVEIRRLGAQIGIVRLNEHREPKFKLTLPAKEESKLVAFFGTLRAGFTPQEWRTLVKGVCWSSGIAA